MVQIIAGRKGKGKTKILLSLANGAVAETEGSICYLDKSGKHMYELNNKVRLINVSEYPFQSFDGFIGFLCGILSQDHDLEHLFLDSFLKLAHVEPDELQDEIQILSDLSEKFGVNMTLSVSMDKDDLPASAISLVTTAL